MPDQRQNAAPLRDTLTAENLARRFHGLYEQLAPEFGYETRPDSAVPWNEVPQKIRHLMIAVCAAILDEERRDAAS